MRSARISATHFGNGARSWRQRQIVIFETRSKRAAAPLLPKANLNARSNRPAGSRRSKRDRVTISEHDGIVPAKGGYAIRANEFFGVNHSVRNSLEPQSLNRSLNDPGGIEAQENPHHYCISLIRASEPQT
jgi:hypothetical protein